jgi:DNA (cytosine-5)-methyltransferase 1
MKPLKIGTDCSGIEAPIQALMSLGISFEHEWSCDIDKYVRLSIQANYKSKVIFEDITKHRKLPKIDLYIAGFPCQTFSIAGNREGMNDPRGTIFYDCIRAIKQSDPTVFILENVKGLLSHNNGDTFKIIMAHLVKLKDYKLHYKVLNTKDYGIPQNRERIFIIGIKSSSLKSEFNWPNQERMKDIHKFIDTKDLTKNNLYKFAEDGVNKSKGVFIDLFWVNRTSSNSYQTYCPTINTKGGLWCKPMKRYANNREYLKLQGFPYTFKQVVSDRQFKKQIGNSMSVNVLKCLLKNILYCVNFN